MATMSFNPQTPQSPSQFSPYVAEHSSSSVNTSMTSVTTTLPTPAHSVNGSMPQGDMSPDIVMIGDSPQKRKCQYDDRGSHEQKKVHLEDPRRIGIENLHLDVGEKYLLCRTPSIPSAPCVSEDLFAKFGLTSIAAEVARTKPNGEKNALRKTYKGQIKSLGLSGHFDAVKKEPMAPGSLMELVHYPQEDWNNTWVAGKNVERGLSQAHLTSLPKATTMAKGPIFKQIWDSSVLGDLAPGNVSKKVNHEQSARGTAPGTPATPAANAAVKSGKLAPQADRTRRIGKKRSYQDSSFEGYGEGYMDDDTGGYSTGEGDGRATLKRRKQMHGGASQLGRPS
ncbi:Rox3-domain-containing protein [Xylariomycetidae sp. FL2044]|nr:Rox3-domain-containing protein [Xylariomycetidae sp. FL2044]